MKISLVAAVAKNGVIGKNNLMPWYIRQETHLFRTLTEGKPVIIGRRTLDSLPNLLENRHLIVLTRNTDLVSGSSTVQFVHSLEEALIAAKPHGKEVIIAGGENVYQQFMPIAHTLHLSMLHEAYEGDAFFPAVRYSEWQPQATTHYEDFSFVTFKRHHAYATA